jgi:hypothetical protein
VAAEYTTTDNIKTRHVLTSHPTNGRQLNERWMNFNHEKCSGESMSAGDLEAEFDRND